MKKVKVALAGKPGFVIVDLDATDGAIFGVNLRNRDGSLVTLEQLVGPGVTIAGITTTDALAEGTRNLYYTQARADARAAAAITAHEAEADPHPQYTTADEVDDAIAAAIGGGVYPAFTATLDPADKSGSLTLSGGDLTVTKSGAGGAHAMVRATHARSGGRWYWEWLVNSDDGNRYIMPGLAAPTDPTNNFPGGSAWGGVSLYGSDAKIYRAGAIVSAAYSTFGVAADVIGCAWDVDNGWMDFSLNDVWMGRNPGSGKLAMVGNVPPGLFPAISIYSGSSVTSLTARFARASLTGTIPTSFNPYNND